MSERLMSDLRSLIKWVKIKMLFFVCIIASIYKNIHCECFLKHALRNSEWYKDPS